MRILFVTSEGCLPQQFTGPHRTLMELSVRLSKMGHEPIVLTGKTSVLGTPDVTVDRTYGFRLFRSNDPAGSIPALCATLYPDRIVIVGGEVSQLVEVCRSCEIPLVTWLFTVEPDVGSDRLLDYEVCNLASSPFVAARMKNLLGIDAVVVPPYIERRKYQGEGPSQGNRVLFVNPVRENGYEIVSHLAKQRPDRGFVFLESRDISQEWRAICYQRALLCGNIEWLAPVDDICPILRKTRLLIVPSFCEMGFGRLVTEAQLAGIPVLASDRGYLAENVGLGGGVLKVDDPVEYWLNHFDQFWDNEAYYQKTSKLALRHALREALDEKVVVDHLMSVLQSPVR